MKWITIPTTSDALLQLRSAAFHLGPREVPIAIIHRLELAAVDRNARIHKQAHLPAEFEILPTGRTTLEPRPLVAIERESGSVREIC